MPLGLKMLQRRRAHPLAWLRRISGVAHSGSRPPSAVVSLSRRAKLSSGPLQEARMRRLAQQMLAHRFEMRAAALHLLADRMNVAEAPLKRIVFENRGGAGFLIDGFHHFTRRLNGEGGRKADGNPLIIRHLKPRFGTRPALAQRFKQQAARRTPARFSARDQALNDMAVAHRARCRCRGFV